MKTLKSDISETYKVQIDCLIIQSLTLMTKIIWNKVEDLVRLHKAMQEKLKHHHIQNKFKFLPQYLLPVSNVLIRIFQCLWILCLNFTWNQRKVGGILEKPAPKKEKTITTETHHLVTNVYEDNKFSSWVRQKKDYVSVS